MRRKNSQNVRKILYIKEKNPKLRLEEWISVLQASYLVILLQPYFENFGKRVIKSTKLYFTDVGLLSYLLGIENVKQMSRDPLWGHLVENLVMS